MLSASSPDTDAPGALYSLAYPADAPEPFALVHLDSPTSNITLSMTVRVLQVRVKGKGGNAIGARTSVRSVASMCENFESWAGSCVRVGVVGTHVHCSCPQLTYQSLPNCNQYLGKSRTSLSTIVTDDFGVNNWPQPVHFQCNSPRRFSWYS